MTAGSKTLGPLVASMTKIFFLVPDPSILVRILVDDTIPGLSSTHALGDEIHLVEHENAGRGRPGLVEQFPDVGFGLPESLGEKLWSPHSLVMALASRVLPQPGGP